MADLMADLFRKTRLTTGEAMDKRKARSLNAFKQIQRQNGRYHVSQYTPHEQAIREHLSRGHSDPRRHGVLGEPVLLDQANKI